MAKKTKIAAGVGYATSDDASHFGRTMQRAVRRSITRAIAQGVDVNDGVEIRKRIDAAREKATADYVAPVLTWDEGPKRKQRKPRAPAKRTDDAVLYEARVQLTCDREISDRWLTQHLRRSAPLITGTVWRGALAGAGAAGNIILVRIGEITRVRR